MTFLRRFLSTHFGSRKGSPCQGLDDILPPEIKDDSFYRIMMEIVARAGIHNILEIGSSSGAGSTEALVQGSLRNQKHPILHCIEISKTRFAALLDRYRDLEFVKCYNISSVPIEKFPTYGQVEYFYRTVKSPLRRVPLEKVLHWLDQDIAYLRQHNLSTTGIKHIKETNKLELFDAVLIDGSEFTGPAELDEVYGAKYLFLDDILTFKNFSNYLRLLKDPHYQLIKKSRWLRNGCAVFERIA
jgi:hypothetical protein